MIVTVNSKLKALHKLRGILQGNTMTLADAREERLKERAARADSASSGEIVGEKNSGATFDKNRT